MIDNLLIQDGIKALHLAVGRDNEPARELYRRTGFKSREHNVLMTRPLRKGKD
jgi:ribosomal protein S18 acetylase RimI-like enzyme